MTKIEQWLLRRLLAREVRQGGHIEKTKHLFCLLREAWRVEFTEDNEATRNAILERCFLSSRDNFVDKEPWQPVEWFPLADAGLPTNAAKAIWEKDLAELADRRDQLEAMIANPHYDFHDRFVDEWELENIRTAINARREEVLAPLSVPRSDRRGAILAQKARKKKESEKDG
jgi:hypothetical protein